MNPIAAALALAILAATTLPADARIQRSKAAVAEFKRENPCPVNGAKRGACPGWEVDHIMPLCSGGAEAKGNMQWLTKQAHAEKTKRDVMKCRIARSKGAFERTQIKGGVLDGKQS